MNVRFIYLIGLLFLISCSPTRNLAYFSDLQNQDVLKEPITNTSVARIQPDDLLHISVNSLNPESNALFNKGVLLPTGNATNLNQSQTTNQEGYLVDGNGFINFPVLGLVKLGGLTKEEAKNKLVTDLNEYLKDPLVNIRFLNFKVTVVGEVNRPSTFTIPTEKINILEALGLAGDMTPFGKRENVLLIEEEGIRTTTRLNLNSKEMLNSPYFYLHQNDVLYVEPDRMKQVQASTNTRTLSILLAATSLATIVIARLF